MLRVLSDEEVGRLDHQTDLDGHLPQLAEDADLALESNAPINTEDFRTLNRCLDDAIASAVTMYERESQKARASKPRTARTNGSDSSSMSCEISWAPPSSRSRFSNRETSASGGAPELCSVAASPGCVI